MTSSMSEHQAIPNQVSVFDNVSDAKTLLIDFSDFSGAYRKEPPQDQVTLLNGSYTTLRAWILHYDWSESLYKVGTLLGNKDVAFLTFLRAYCHGPTLMPSHLGLRPAYVRIRNTKSKHIL